MAAAAAAAPQPGHGYGSAGGKAGAHAASTAGPAGAAAPAHTGQAGATATADAAATALLLPTSLKTTDAPGARKGKAKLGRSLQQPGCQYHVTWVHRVGDFVNPMAHELEQDPDVEVVVYQGQHVDASGACCHGPQCAAARNTRLECDAHLSEECKGFVYEYVLHHPDASVDTVLRGGARCEGSHASEEP